MRQTIIIILLALFAVSGWAQEANDSTKAKKQRELIVYMEVADHLTHQGLDSIWGVLRNASDNSAVDTLKIEKYEYEGKLQSYVEVIVNKPGSYVIEINAEGYESKTIPLKLPKLYKNEKKLELKTCYLKKARKPREHDLDEVVVTATKLKFYMDGDTLVYNADAFSMAEGSMLGELVKKLPGVEVKNGGEIMVNGKKVESLLLNGKDFFDSDHELLLENMPAYMVSKIQTYERVPIDVQGTNREKTTPKETVMNVKLKKDYNAGWLANAEVGASPVDIYTETDKNTSFNNKYTKYLGRVFALRFDDRSRLSLYANANNLNDSRSPGENGDWSPASQPRDISKAYTAGGNYQYGEYGKFRYEGSAKVTYNDNQAVNHSSSQTFLDGGDQFGRSFTEYYDSKLNARTEHELRNRWKNLSWAKYLSVAARVDFNYDKWDNHGQSANATFTKDMTAELGREWIDSIKAPNAGEAMRKYAINRILKQYMGKGHSTDVNARGFLSFGPKHNDMTSISVAYQARYNDRHDNYFEHYKLEYPMGGSETDFRNKYTPTNSKSYEFGVTPQSLFFLGEKRQHTIGTVVVNNYSYSQSNNSLYLLNHLQGWDNKDNHALGTLPSETELLSTLDADNSTRAIEKKYSLRPEVEYSFHKHKDNRSNYVKVSISMPSEFQHLDYWQGAQVDTAFTRRTTFLIPDILFVSQNYRTSRYFYISYYYGTSAPSMTSMLDIRNTSDPLNIQLSNPNLKNRHTHYFNTSYRNKFGRTLFNANANGSYHLNSVAYGYIMDRTTGVKTITPENVDGNWNMNMRSEVDFPLTKSEKWRMKEVVGYNYNHNVDLFGVDGAEKATRSVVGSHYINNEWRLTWRPSDKMEFSTKANVHYQHSTGDRIGFQTINVFDFDYGATAQLELPWNMQFSTDATMFSRRGYDDRSMNTNELVWNARLTKRLMHGNLLIQLDALDMLGQLSNVSRYINAQGKSETFYNVMPSYLLAHITWRLNKK
ncbi:MAG: outer membrane beta-barrel protein [Prevotellaceae bacterium]|nr:outer membrane beta-barrel protein [Prevotellaceae bacterium]